PGHGGAGGSGGSHLLLQKSLSNCSSVSTRIGRPWVGSCGQVTPGLHCVGVSPFFHGWKCTRAANRKASNATSARKPKKARSPPPPLWWQSGWPGGGGPGGWGGSQGALQEQPQSGAQAQPARQLSPQLQLHWTQAPSGCPAVPFLFLTHICSFTFRWCSDGSADPFSAEATFMLSWASASLCRVVDTSPIRSRTSTVASSAKRLRMSRYSAFRGAATG